MGDEVASTEVTTDAQGKATANFKLSAGVFRVLLETEDRFGKKVTAQLPIKVLNPASNKLALKVPDLVSAPKWTLEPGQEFSALWGSGYDKARAFIEIEHRRKVIQSFWTDAANTQQMVKQTVGEAMRGGFTLRVTMVRGKMRLFEFAARGCALDEQEPHREMGALCLEAGAEPQGNLHGRHHRSRRETGRGRNGGDSLRRVARPVPAAQLDATF